jgi:hypothetical protein
MTEKVRTTLYIDKEVIMKAKKLGLNLSVVCENSLIQAIEAMESFYGNKESSEYPVSYLKKENGGRSRDRTCDPRHVKAMSYH